MAPPLQYPHAVIRQALRAARSLKQAARLIGMNPGSLRKRALRDRDLKPLALACLERGKRFRSDSRAQYLGTRWGSDA